MQKKLFFIVLLREHCILTKFSPYNQVIVEVGTEINKGV